MTWSKKTSVVMGMEGMFEGLEGSIFSTGEGSPSVKVIHNGDNGTQSVGYRAVEKYAEENGFHFDVQRFGESEDIYELTPKDNENELHL